jgi:hypothetical protein
MMASLFANNEKPDIFFPCDQLGCIEVFKNARELDAHFREV